MKIDLLHYSAPPIVGGVESVIGHQARLMADAGHQVRILAGRGAQVDARVPFLSLPLVDSRNPQVQSVKQYLDRGIVPQEFSNLVDDIFDLLQETLRDTDILIAHNVCSLHKNLPLTAAIRRIADSRESLRLILWHHDLAWTSARYLSELHAGYPWDLLRTDWDRAQQVVVSELRQKELAKLAGIPTQRVKVIPNGIDVQGFLGLQAESWSIAERLNLLDAAPLLLLPVRITLRKNIELALQTLARLSETYPNAMLVVTGPLGPHNPANVDYYESLLVLRTMLGLEKRAHFLAEVVSGYLPDAVVAQLYRLADALFLPSREEGFGIPVLEAGLAGIPIFCSAIQPLLSLAGMYATYFDPDIDPEELARRISEQLAGDLVAQMRLKVRQNYTWRQIYQQHITPLLA
jgi:glycosyltransferase involved in cell wall biosynthesis